MVFLMSSDRTSTTGPPRSVGFADPSIRHWSYAVGIDVSRKFGSKFSRNSVLMPTEVPLVHCVPLNWLSICARISACKRYRRFDFWP